MEPKIWNLILESDVFFTRKAVIKLQQVLQVPHVLEVDNTIWGKTTTGKIYLVVEISRENI